MTTRIAVLPALAVTLTLEMNLCHCPKVQRSQSQRRIMLPLIRGLIHCP